MKINEATLIESKTMRDGLLDKEGVLEKVGSLVLLPDDVHATTELVARFYGVGDEAVKSLIKDHREEIESSGLRTVRGEELKQLKEDVSAGHGCKVPEGPSINPKISQLTLFNRRTILNVGMLLRDSEVAKQVRNYLLNLDEFANQDQRILALRAEERVDFATVRNFFKDAGGEWYGTFQDEIYMMLFDGMRASDIKKAQPRRINVEQYVRGPKKGQFKEGPAKDHLTERQLKDLHDFTNFFLTYLTRVQDLDGTVTYRQVMDSRQRALRAILD